MQSDLTAEIAAWVAEVDEGAFSGLARARALQALGDTIACMVAGAGDPAADNIRTIARSAGGTGNAVMVGSISQAAPSFAALANATSAHALDFDDTVGHALSHPSAVMFPALLALAEEHDLCCDAVLTAWIVGLEVQVALGRGINRGHYDTGWHATATVGLIGAAAACAKLMSLDQLKILAAISLATSMISGSKGQFGTMAKPVHAGLAAKSAMLAAVMAAEGITARPDPLEGRYGFLELYCRGGVRDFAPILAELGRPPAIEWLGLDTKQYPCCSSSHPALDALADLQAEHGFHGADVAAVQATIHHGPSLALIRTRPRDEIEARFSLPYAAAALLIGGQLELADFTAEGFARPDVQALIDRIEMRTWPLDTREPALAEAVVTLRDGRRLARKVEAVSGSIARPMTVGEFAAKFEDCARGILDDSAFETLVDLLADADRALPVRRLMQPLAFVTKVDRGDRFLRRSCSQATKCG